MHWQKHIYTDTLHALHFRTLTVTSGAAFAFPSSAKAIMLCNNCSDFNGTSGRSSLASRAHPDSNMLCAMTVARTSAWPMQSRSWIYLRIVSAFSISFVPSSFPTCSLIIRGSEKSPSSPVVVVLRIIPLLLLPPSLALSCLALFIALNFFERHASAFAPALMIHPSIAMEYVLVSGATFPFHEFSSASSAAAAAAEEEEEEDDDSNENSFWMRSIRNTNSITLRATEASFRQRVHARRT
mmetsp:Transcript_29042/g.55015  ORF Transcript_29042/g.55015 Transcript_29042/m.55015 type:complete len:240 (-) Transcript_29042:656-1375(-)